MWNDEMFLKGTKSIATVLWLVTLYHILAKEGQIAQVFTAILKTSFLSEQARDQNCWASLSCEVFVCMFGARGLLCWIVPCLTHPSVGVTGV